MLWSVIRLIFKTSSVSPDFFFYVFHLILSFSTCSESFEKIRAWELLGGTSLSLYIGYCIVPGRLRPISSHLDRTLHTVGAREIGIDQPVQQAGTETLLS